MLGETSALLTSLCWSCSSVAFSSAGRRVGSPAVNHVRLWFALVVLVAIHSVAFGAVFPFDAPLQALVCFAFSGVVGYSIGDALLFESFVLIGPRLSMLLLTLSPIFGALLAWVFLGETLGLLEIAGIAITVAGIGVVVSDGGRDSSPRPTHYLTGVLLGIGGAACGAAGMLLSKMGYVGGISPFSANVIRVTAGASTMGIAALVRGVMLSDFQKMRDRPALLATLIGTVGGPVFGVIFSLHALFHAEIGVASTLMSLSPIILIPVAHFFHGERITWRAVAGTLVAMAGVVLLFLRA